ncbi:hypothetical protein RUND412_005457 [Rhizina undulata]
MKPQLFILLACSVFTPALSRTSHSRESCQYPTQNALSGCPPGTIFISANDSHASFMSIQSAIESLPNDTTPHTILIGAGIYTEQLNITRPGPLTLLGQTKDPKRKESNLVTVQWAAAVVNSNFADDEFTAVLTVSPTLDASLTGSGTTGFAVPDDTPFGNVDFKAYNIDWNNNYANYAAGQSLALSLSRANGGFYYNRFYSYQDTIYVGKLGNAYFYKNEIAGTTDFLYGFGTAFISHSNLTLRSCGGGISAWKGTNTTFENTYGVYISDSYIQKANSSLSITNKCFLGRPWNSLHRSVFMNNYMDDSIAAQGYEDWVVSGVSRLNNYTYMAEYASYGPGWNETGRIEGNVTRLIGKKEAEKWNSPQKVFLTADGKHGETQWLDLNA